MKKLSESFIGDIRSNIDEIQPVGISVITEWADRDLEVNGMTVFNYNMVKELLPLFKEKGWRLPTLEDTKIFNKPTGKPKIRIDREGFYFREGNEILHFNRTGYVTSFNNETYQPNDYYCWTSNVDIGNPNKHHMIKLTNNNFYVWGGSDKDLCQIRLVRDIK